MEPAAAATGMFMYVYVKLHQMFLGLRFLECQGLLHSMRRPGWERWWIGEASCPFTIKRSLDWNAINQSLGKLLPFKLRKMEMMRLAQGTNAFWLFFWHHKCNTQNDFWCYQHHFEWSESWSQVCTLWRASRQSWENLPTSKASKKWCQQRPDIQFTGIRKTKNQYIVMKLTWIGHDDHTSILLNCTLISISD